MKYTKDNNPKIKTAMEQKKTAKQILEKYYPHSIGQKDNVSLNVNPLKSSILEMMEEYAKEVGNGSDKGYSRDDMKKMAVECFKAAREHKDLPLGIYMNRVLPTADLILHSLTPSQPEVKENYCVCHESELSMINGKYICHMCNKPVRLFFD